MERGAAAAAALSCTFRSPSPSPAPRWRRPLLGFSSRVRGWGRGPRAVAGAPRVLLLPPGRRFSYCTQSKFLDINKRQNKCSLATFSSFGHPGISLNNEDSVKDKLLIDCGEDQDCVIDGIVALGKFDALHIGHRELAVYASKAGTPFLLSFVGIAEVLGWEYRPPIVAQCDRKRVLSSWAPYCRNVVPMEYQVEFSKVRYLTPRQFVERLSKDLKIKGVVAGENYRFGYKASGDASELITLCEEFGLSAFIVRSVMDTTRRSDNGVMTTVNSSDRGQVSSSRVRHALAMGDMEYVSELLGRKHRLMLTVKENHLQERKRIVLPKSSMLNMPPADGLYENCDLINGGHRGLCRVIINSETIDIEMKDGNSLLPNTIQEHQQLGIEFG
ncbi:FAD synthetase, chloroplastic [Oryza brachyantha]|nr:FAD synthetase, chloroplastic [Oryza brachyantha]